MKKLVLFAAANVLLAGFVHAGPLQTNEVSGSAKWAAHLDIERVLSTQLGNLILGELRIRGELEKFTAFRRIFGFSPLDDLRSITIYGRSYGPQQEVIMIKGTFDIEKLNNLLIMNENYQEYAHNTHKIHEWIDHEKQQFGCFYRSDFIMIGSSKQNIQDALDVLDGVKENMDGSSNLAGLRVIPEGACIMAAAEDFSGEAGADPRAVVLNHADQLSLVMGEVNGRNYLDITLVAKDQMAASQIHQVTQGMVAFGLLMRDKFPVLAQLAQAVELSVEGEKVQFYQEHSAEKVFAILKKLHAIQAKKHALLKRKQAVKKTLQNIKRKLQVSGEKN